MPNDHPFGAISFSLWGGDLTLGANRISTHQTWPDDTNTPIFRTKHPSKKPFPKTQTAPEGAVHIQLAFDDGYGIPVQVCWRPSGEQTVGFAPNAASHCQALSAFVLSKPKPAVSLLAEAAGADKFSNDK